MYRIDVIEGTLQGFGTLGGYIPAIP